MTWLIWCWELGTELQSSLRVRIVLNYLVISLAWATIILITFYFKITFIYYLHMGAKSLPQLDCGSRRITCRSHFFPSTMWVTEIKPRSSNFAASSLCTLPTEAFSWPYPYHILLATYNLGYAAYLSWPQFLHL